MKTHDQLMKAGLNQLKSIYVTMAISLLEYEKTIILNIENNDVQQVINLTDNCRDNAINVLETLPVNFLELLNLTQEVFIDINSKNTSFNTIHNKIMKSWDMEIMMNN
jgi:hypothetical protein